MILKKWIDLDIADSIEWIACINLFLSTCEMHSWINILSGSGNDKYD